MHAFFFPGCLFLMLHKSEWQCHMSTACRKLLTNPPGHPEGHRLNQIPLWRRQVVSPCVIQNKSVFKPKCQTHPFPLSPNSMHEVFIAEGFLHFLLARGLFLWGFAFQLLPCSVDCRLGGTLYSFHSSILNCLLPQLTSPRLAVRKRAIIALSHLVLTCSGNIFSELTEHLLAELKRNESTSTTRTYIQCVAGISRQAGHRIGRTSSLKLCWEMYVCFRAAPFSCKRSALPLFIMY